MISAWHALRDSRAKRRAVAWLADNSLIDDAAQIAISHHYWMIDGELETLSSPHRYVWPAELDLMARLAGLRLAERWGGWHREPFTGESTSHISVWEKPA